MANPSYEIYQTESGETRRKRVAPQAECLRGFRLGKRTDFADRVLTGVDAMILLMHCNGPMKTVDIRDSFMTWVDGEAVYTRRQHERFRYDRAHGRGRYVMTAVWFPARALPGNLSSRSPRGARTIGEGQKTMKRWRRSSKHTRGMFLEESVVETYWCPVKHGVWTLTTGGMRRAGDLLAGFGEL